MLGTLIRLRSKSSSQVNAMTLLPPVLVEQVYGTSTDLRAAAVQVAAVRLYSRCRRPLSKRALPSLPPPATCAVVAPSIRPVASNLLIAKSMRHSEGLSHMTESYLRETTDIKNIWSRELSPFPKSVGAGDMNESCQNPSSFDCEIFLGKKAKNPLQDVTRRSTILNERNCACFILVVFHPSSSTISGKKTAEKYSPGKGIALPIPGRPTPPIL